MTLADRIASGWEPFLDPVVADAPEQESSAGSIPRGPHSELLAAALAALSENDATARSGDERANVGPGSGIPEVLAALLAKHVQDALFALECRAWSASLAGSERRSAVAEPSLWAGTHTREQNRSAIASIQGAPWADRLGGVVLERESGHLDLPVFGLDDVSGGKRDAFSIPAGAIWTGIQATDSPRVGEAALVADTDHLYMEAR